MIRLPLLAPMVASALALILVACGQPAAGSVAPSPSTSAAAVAVTLSDFDVLPDATQPLSGSIALAVTNQGPTPHNLTIRDAAGAVVGGSPELRAGQATSLSVTLGAGEYVLFCSLPGHESLGMRAGLVVVAGS